MSAYKQRPWRERGKFDFKRPTFVGLLLRYFLMTALFVLSVGPFLWELATSFKGPTEDIYQFPPTLLPQAPTLENYASVMRNVPVLSYTFHSLCIGVAAVISNVVLATLGGYALGVLRFRGKKVVWGILLSTLLLPGEVSIMSQYRTIQALGLADTLVGVFLPGAVGAVNVMLMATAARSIPKEVFDAATVDGAGTWQQIRHVLWPNVRGMASVIGVFSFIGAWDDFLWPLIVLSTPDNYTLTIGMNYLKSAVSAGDPRVIAAGTIIALVPVIVVFATMQKFFFAGVEEGAVKG